MQDGIWIGDQYYILATGPRGVQGAPVVAAVYDPNRRELFTAEAGEGSWVNGERLAVSSRDTVIESIKKTARCVIVEEGWPVASISSYVASEIMGRAFDWLDAPVVRVGNGSRTVKSR